MSKINVLIMDMSKKICQALNSLISNVEEFAVVGASTSRAEGNEVITRFTPDVILLDVNLIETDAANPLDLILKNKHTPVIILAHSSIEETSQTVRAMLNGAVDFVKLPDDIDPEDKVLQALITQKIMNAIKVNAVKKEGYESEQMDKGKQAKPKERVERSKPKKRHIVANSTKIAEINNTPRKSQTFVAIGTSTGGPRALHAVLEGFTADFPAPIFIVQHMPAAFTKPLAERLDKLKKLHVKEAVDGEKAENGIAYVAPGDYHMRVIKVKSDYYIELNQAAERSGHRPSVDVLFDSIALISDVNKIVVVLTGMGRDGAEGIVKIKDNDEEAIVIAESEDTAIINGMPQAAVNTGKVTEVLRLEEISYKVINYANRLGVG